MKKFENWRGERANCMGVPVVNVDKFSSPIINTFDSLFI